MRKTRVIILQVFIYFAFNIIPFSGAQNNYDVDYNTKNVQDSNKVSYQPKPADASHLHDGKKNIDTLDYRQILEEINALREKFTSPEKLLKSVQIDPIENYQTYPQNSDPSNSQTFLIGNPKGYPQLHPKGYSYPIYSQFNPPGNPQAFSPESYPPANSQSYSPVNLPQSYPPANLQDFPSAYSQAYVPANHQFYPPANSQPHYPINPQAYPPANQQVNAPAHASSKQNPMDGVINSIGSVSKSMMEMITGLIGLFQKPSFKRDLEHIRTLPEDLQHSTKQ